MRILIFSDVHWSTNSSIIRKRGKLYSERLEHLINSMNWVNETAIKNNCDTMICAGDFFDKSQCTDEEITALREIKWNNLESYFLCGNHESSVSDLRFNSLKALENCQAKRYVISDQGWSIKADKTQIHFIPYIVESDRQPLENYLDKDSSCTKHIIISHNDIQGITYGGFESKIGFSIKELEENASLVLNGHLHNSEFITKKILNVGSVSAHNFTNDSEKYTYGVWILDTTTSTVEFIENPYGFTFYKFEINKKSDLTKLNTIKNNAVISIKCAAELVTDCKAVLETDLKDKIIESKITINHLKTAEESSITIADLQVDHLAKFVEFCKTNISNTAVLEAELTEICK